MSDDYGGAIARFGRGVRKGYSEIVTGVAQFLGLAGLTGGIVLGWLSVMTFAFVPPVAINAHVIAPVLDLDPDSMTATAISAVLLVPWNVLVTYPLLRGLNEVFDW